MTFTQRLNAALDSLPLPRLNVLGREVPTFRTCGITGFYVALLVLFGAGLLSGRSLLVLAALALVSGLSFFAYTYLRMWITGREELVLLEHVWFALACNSGALLWMSEPVLPYLDLVSVALCPFLAAGRVGCTLVGCCHGQPSSFGITYDEACARDGFTRHLVGVRLFPVPAIEGVGLLVIGAIGLVALPFAQPGKVFAWYLISYSVMRFGLEGIRGDVRPHFLGLSQARWMAIIEVGLVLHLTAGEHRLPALVTYAALFATLAGALAIRWRRNWRRPLLTPAHIHELRELVRSEVERTGNVAFAHPRLRTTSQQTTAGISVSGSPSVSAAYVSLSLPSGRSDLPALCELAGRAFPELILNSTRFTAGRVLHLLVPLPLRSGEADGNREQDRGRSLYGSVVRQLQCGADSLSSPPRPVTEISPEHANPLTIPVHEEGTDRTPWYFAGVHERNR